jgi:hypothetical protein
MSRNIQKILTKEMSRKEFLSYIGLLLLTVFGISAFLKNISALNPTKSKGTKRIPKSSFGSGAYGV